MLSPRLYCAGPCWGSGTFRSWYCAKTGAGLSSVRSAGRKRAASDCPSASASRSRTRRRRNESPGITRGGRRSRRSYQGLADARRLQQRFVTFSLISREELAYDAKPGSPRTPREPQPESRGSLVSEKTGGIRSRYRHSVTALERRRPRAAPQQRQPGSAPPPSPGEAIGRYPKSRPKARSQ